VRLIGRPKNLKRNFSKEILDAIFFDLHQVHNILSNLPLPKPQTLSQPSLPAKQTQTNNINPQSTTKQIPIKPREAGKCWGRNEPWTLEHMFRCKFRKASHAMAMEPEHWLEAGQQMEKLNHTLLQPDPTNTTDQDTPQLLMISFHVVQRTCSAATFLLIVPVGGK
jgi:hypothetical protein